MNTVKRKPVKRSIYLTAETYDALKAIASGKGWQVSELIRDYIGKGMNVDKTASDIDFIRKQIREEMDIMLRPQINRLAKMLMRIGMMTISFCYFNGKVLDYFVPWDEQVSYEELMAECKHDAAAYLNIRDATLDAAFREFNANNP
jgi:hypothetical protein